MGLFKRLFCKNKKIKSVPMLPTWEEIVELMYNKGLDHFVDEVVLVLYSKDKSKRYVLLKRQDGFYTYTCEQIYVYDAEEWQYVYENERTLPAMWAVIVGGSNSIFERLDDALNELKNESEFKTYFI